MSGTGISSVSRDIPTIEKTGENLNSVHSTSVPGFPSKKELRDDPPKSLLSRMPSFPTITGTLLVVLLSITLLLFVILSDVRAARHSSSPLVGYQHGEETRSTMDIVFTCLSTMAICSISAMHFDLPGVGGGFFTLPKQGWEKTVVTVMFWTIGLLMPEIIVFIACRDYRRALHDFRSIDRIRSPDWSLTHSFFAQMGGFRVNGRVVKDGSKLADNHLWENRVDWKQIGNDISDKSKKDVLSKCIAVVQIGRFLLAMISRAATSLPISPLEYFTCAQVVCALFMYIFWFYKPHNVQFPIALPATKEPVEESLSEERISDGFSWTVFLVSGYAAALVGASALGQWNAQFSTPSSQTLWRAFSIVSATLPLLTVVVVPLHSFLEGGLGEAVLTACFTLHCLNRLVLIGLVFYSFVNLPADVYKTVNWLVFIAFIQ